MNQTRPFPAAIRPCRAVGATRAKPAAGPVQTVLTLMLALLPGALAAAEPAMYELDPVHTRVMFSVGHAGFSKALGTVSGSTGVLVFDPQDWSRAQLEVRVPLTRLDLGDAKWNAATLARNLLDGERHPEARFVSTAVIPHDDTRARVCGNLSLRGVIRPLCMDVTLNAIKRHPMPPFRRTAGFSAMAMLSRSDFGIDAWQKVIGDQVELRIEAEAVRTRRTGAAAAPEPLQAPAPQDGTDAGSASDADLLFEDELDPGAEIPPPSRDEDRPVPPADGSGP